MVTKFILPSRMTEESLKKLEKTRTSWKPEDVERRLRRIEKLKGCIVEQQEKERKFRHERLVKAALAQN